MNYRIIAYYISLLSVVGKIYTGIQIERIRRVTGGLIEDEQGGFRARNECVDKIFTLKQIGEKAREKNVECMWVL